MGVELGTRSSSFIVCVEEREAEEGGNGRGRKRGKAMERINKRGMRTTESSKEGREGSKLGEGKEGK